jgi:SRSO17 transposase
VENGIVSVNAYGVLDHLTFPLLFTVDKPHTRLLPGDTYKTKPPLAGELSKELRARGFPFDPGLADRLYGESTEFLEAMEELHRKEGLAIRSNHGMWLPAGQHVRFTRWRPFERVFSDGEPTKQMARVASRGIGYPHEIVENKKAEEHCYSSAHHIKGDSAVS